MRWTRIGVHDGPEYAYALPRPVSDRDLHLMKLIGMSHLEMPFAGLLMLRDRLALAGSKLVVSMSQR